MSAVPSVTAYWWPDVKNWGDLLSPLLLHRFSHVDVTWADPSTADVACVGSILGNWIKSDYNGIILGSGKLFSDALVPSHATVLALRGPLTALGVKGHFVLGDPGLLADELVTIDPKAHNLGLVPHWSDHTLALDPQYTKFDPLIIHSSGDPLGVIKKIGSCRRIVSSSLHGLIVADAFNIPRKFSPTADWAREGGVFKVRDHCAAVGLTFAADGKHEMQQANSSRIADLKSGLWDAFSTFGAMIRART
jgi:pyruvyltransferase